MKPFRSVSLLLPVMFTSCCTMGLWGFQWEDDSDGDEDGSYVAVPGTQWQWWRVLLRIAATPITLVADVGICSLEGAISGVIRVDDEDDHAACASSYTSPSRCRGSKSRSAAGRPTREGALGRR